ncbi:MCE family protein [Pseudonocardia sp. NPDC049154]|uniref:MCE family protein n=1 Tax=Pseudonocardia sp. NPDC049154 TaxID=3155501 RepID=UPI003400F7AD
MSSTPRSLKIAAVAVAVVLVAAVTLLVTQTSTKTVVADFDQTISLYPGDEVRVLGVQVGTIDDVEALPDRIRVTMSYNADVELPESAQAAIIAPSLVGIRYIQLSPAYTGGPALADGGEIPLARTVSPVEWDRIKNQLTAVADALGPQPDGGDKPLTGPVTRALDTTSANLDGQGAAINDTLTSLSSAITTLSDGRGDLFGTVRNLGVFATALKDADAQVGRFNTQLDQVSQVLADNRESLAVTLDTIDRTVPIIEGFVADVRGPLQDNLKTLGVVAKEVSDHRQGLADILQVAPGAVSNFANIVDDRSGAVTAALGVTNLQDPAAFVCDAAAAVAPGGAADPTAANACRSSLGGLLDVFRMPNIPVQANPLVRGGGPPAGAGGLPQLLVPIPEAN